MTDLVTIARSRVQANACTHWEGCERSHYECLIQRLADELERTRDNLKAIEDEKNAYIDYVGDALGQDEDRETLWDAAQRVLSERDRLRADLLTKDGENLELLAEVERLHTRCAELEKDAARYRWLRGDAPPHSERWSRWDIQRWGGVCWDPLERETLDEAIDAAMEGKP